MLTPRVTELWRCGGNPNYEQVIILHPAAADSSLMVKTQIEQARKSVSAAREHQATAAAALGRASTEVHGAAARALAVADTLRPPSRGARHRRSL